MADVLGVSLAAEAEGRLNFLTPAEDSFKDMLAPQDYLIHEGIFMQIKLAGAEILATRTRPWFDPDKRNVSGGFSSIHSNPPGPRGTEPALTRNVFGKGTAVYSAMAFERVEEEINTHVLSALMRSLLQRPPWFEAKAHPSVEITYFDQPENERVVLSVVVNQADLPNVPVDVTIRARIPNGANPKDVVLLPDETLLNFRRADGDYIEFDLRQVPVFAMVAVGYGV